MVRINAKLKDWLDDLCVRFIINLPREELESVERICFQVEEAQWFYEDFVRPLDPGLPSLSLKSFAMCIFQHCPLMSQWSPYHHMTAFSEFLAYKTRVPVRGAIMLNESMDQVVLVKGWKKSASWSFPRGKINKDEKDLDCAIREVYEETGFDIQEAGLVKDEKDMKYIEVTMREQHMRLYVFRGVPMDTHFAPRTRKEISKIEWYKLSELPIFKKSKQQDVSNANKFYMVAPFLHPLKEWIAQQRKLDAQNQMASVTIGQTEGETSMDEAVYTTNGRFTSRQKSLEVAIPSDLPEVTPSEDVSSHLKRLLNIGGPVVVPPSVPAPSSFIHDSSKSNALLALLRSGSNNVGTQASGNDGRKASQMSATPISPLSHIPSPSQPSPYHTQQGLSPVRHLPPPNAGFSTLPQVSQPESSFPPRSGLPPIGGLQNRPAHNLGLSNQVKAFQHAPSSGPTYHPGQQIPAPYQQTGDPQFAQQMHSTKAQGPAVPPASRLPPPKLTSHSLALLNVFKSNAPPTSKPVDPAVISHPEPAPTTSDRMQHQDNLLNLLQGSSLGSMATTAAELSAHPAPLPEQILQRPSNLDGKHLKKPANFKTMRRDDEALTSATVSGPLKTPEFERIGRASKKANDSPLRTGKDRGVPASPITILSRPPTAKRESPVSSELTSRSPSQTLKKTKSPETPKNFQPQILRRSDKLDLNTVLPTRTIAVHELSQPRATDKEVCAPQQKVTQPNYDRRPSQTAAQKEALLSLFRKSPVPRVPTLAGQTDDRPSTSQSSVISVNADAVSSPDHSGREGVLPTVWSFGSSSDAAACTPGLNQVTSPDNKAFLLGFLEGVAQGKR